MALKGLKVVEIAGLAPAPFCGMILADFGASVVRVDKTGLGNDVDCLARNKRSLALDLKSPDGLNILKRLTTKSDVLIEPFRPGVMEKLGFGPKEAFGLNPGLVYARLSGYGQTGPLSQVAGHDINYLALSGLLSLMGGSGNSRPRAPVNFAADFAGGGLLCAFGIMAALFERSRTGLGQVVDASLTEGAAYVGSWMYRSQKLDFAWPRPKECEANLLDGGYPLYRCYQTKDGLWMAVGALEPTFAQAFLQGLDANIDLGDVGEKWEEIAEKIAQKFQEKTRQEWCQIFDKLDACVTPVLSLEEAPQGLQAAARKSFRQGAYGSEPVPAPLLSCHATDVPQKDVHLEAGTHSVQILEELNYSKTEIVSFINSGVVGQQVPQQRAKL